MMRVAITGGMGSGKSHVCRFLEARNIAIYDCDSVAKRLIANSLYLRKALYEVVGNDIFRDEKLDKVCLARYIVESEDNAQRIDNIVHPAVAMDFSSSGYEWVESAILFESGFYKRIEPDIVICVTADMETRIHRIMVRDKLTREKAFAWIECQMSQETKLWLSDYEIRNDDSSDVEGQIIELLKTINNK